MLANLQGRKCVVVGAGRTAATKTAGLLAHGAQVTVVSPKAVRRIQADARRGKLTWHQRPFVPRDLQGAFLAVSATNSPTMNEAVFRACSARGILCNVVDDPEHCDFFYPAVVRRGPLQIAISTNGYSPALAARLRRELERQFGREWGAWVEQVGLRRQELLRQAMPARARRRRLLELVSPRAFRMFQRRSQQRRNEAK